MGAAAARRRGAGEADHRAGGKGRHRGRQGGGAMSPGVIALVMLGILVFAIMIGYPVAFTLMALGVGFGYYAYFQPGTDFFDNRVFSLLTQNTYGVMTNDALVSIPCLLYTSDAADERSSV